MNVPIASEYWNVCEEDLHTLQNDLHAWDLFELTPGMQALPSTWLFRCKRFSDGSVKKFKDRFCVRGDFQEQGADFLDTWSPVVQWSTGHIMLVLSIILGLSSSQADITAAFLHAELPSNENIYVHQHCGFQKHTGCVLKLNHSLYGLRQSP